MQTIPQASSSLYDLASRLDRPFPACDPEFDAVYDDLDREFAHLRLHPDANDGGAYA
jgi:hypothetical protein